MPRIPESELERLKKEVSLARLIESQGHKLQKRGKDWVMRCVFHEEATPSLSISESKNLYHCFGCNASGSVIDWVMKTQGVSLPHAVQILKDGAPAPTADDLKAWLKDRLIAYQVPVHIRFVPDFPRTPSMKPSAPGLRVLFAEG